VAEPPALGSDAQSRAIGSLIWKDPERIIAFAADLRESNALLECQLRGGSMESAIPRGSTIRIQMSKPRQYQIGEVVAFVRESGLCVHRIVHQCITLGANEYVITRGDGCVYPDPPVNLAKVLGRVINFKHGQDWQMVDYSPPSDARIRLMLADMLVAITSALIRINVSSAGMAARVFKKMFG